MRDHINLFESQEQEIHKFMEQNGIQKYEITPEGVDVHQDVWLSNSGLLELPFQFNIVHGNFSGSNNELESLRGAARVVHGNFGCSYNYLESLEFCPKFIKKEFYCSGNKISPWEHRYLLFSEIQGGINTNNKKLDWFFIKYKNQKALIPEALKELRLLQIKWEQENA